MTAISARPAANDLDADYSPQYVKLARIVRDKIQSGHYKQGDTLRAADLASEHKVSVQVAQTALAMLAANRYVNTPKAFHPHSVIWQADS